MNKKSKKGIYILILSIVIISIAIILKITGSFQAKKAEEGANPSVAEVATEAALQSDVSFGESKVNAYEYILGIMNSPQYWSEEEYFPVYSADYLEDEARKTLINATGWELADIKTATFKRGYKTQLSISFAEHKAVSKDEAKGVTYVLDYKNDDYYVEMNGQVLPVTLHKDEDGYWNTSFGMLEKTFTDYEKLFRAAGCPLLEMAEGTLEKYKSLKVYPASLKEDDLIHAVWKEDGFSFNWENSDLPWLENYKDIQRKEVPESELYETSYERLDGSIEHYMIGGNSPLYLVLADKNSSKQYQGTNTWFEEISVYDNIVEGLATYYLAPAMKNLYGYDAVYFTDAANISGPSDVYRMSTRNEFDKGFSINYKDGRQAILELFPKGNMFVSVAYTYDINNYDFLMLEQKVRDLYSYYGQKYPYADDYVGNFLLVYSLEAQTLLGLR